MGEISEKEIISNKLELPYNLSGYNRFNTCHNRGNVNIIRCRRHYTKNEFINNIENGITIASICIICIFVTKILTKLILVGPRYLFNGWNSLDISVITASSMLKIYALLPPNPYRYGESAHIIEDVIGKENSHHLMVSLIRRSDRNHNEHQDVKRSTTTMIIIGLWKFINIIHGVVHLVEMKNKLAIEKISKEHIKYEEKI